MAEARFLSSISDLTSKVAIVTGGAAGIGLETTIYLALKGATVYVASRNPEKCEKGIAVAQKLVGGGPGKIIYHALDLSSIRSAKESVNRFREYERRLDIIICNAGIGMCSLSNMSPDGYERSFATNHLGHFVFVQRLLTVIEFTARAHGEARIVVTSSMAHELSPRLDYDKLTMKVDDDGKRLWDVKNAMVRYGTSKLANVYFAAELDRRFRERGVNNVYCNSCHPGSVPTTGLGAGERVAIPLVVQKMVRMAISVFSNSAKDAAKTQAYLAGSRQIAKEDVRGQYWVPIWTGLRRYKGCRRQELSELASDKEEAKRLWAFSAQAVEKVLGTTPLSPSTGSTWYG